MVVGESILARLALNGRPFLAEFAKEDGDELSRLVLRQVVGDPLAIRTPFYCVSIH